jgi:hypothetical protein
VSTATVPAVRYTHHFLLQVEKIVGKTLINDPAHFFFFPLIFACGSLVGNVSLLMHFRLKVMRSAPVRTDSFKLPATGENGRCFIPSVWKVTKVTKWSINE